MVTSALARLILWRSRRDGVVEGNGARPEEGDGDPLGPLLARFDDMGAALTGRVVLDFGCGHGEQSVALARRGASRVLAVDSEPNCLAAARERIDRSGAADRVVLAPAIPREFMGRIDVIVSLNVMEHVSDPAGILALWYEALAPGGVAYVSFGPPWYAPYGAHMHFFTMIPWIHLLFPERAVLRARARFRSDGAERYEDVEGGLGRVSVRRFERAVRASGLIAGDVCYETVRDIPVARIPLLRELFINNVAVKLQKAPLSDHRGIMERGPATRDGIHTLR